MGNGSGGNIHWLSNLATETPVWMVNHLQLEHLESKRVFSTRDLPAVSNMVPPLFHAPYKFTRQPGGSSPPKMGFVSTFPGFHKIHQQNLKHPVKNQRNHGKFHREFPHFMGTISGDVFLFRTSLRVLKIPTSPRNS